MFKPSQSLYVEILMHKVMISGGEASVERVLVWSRPEWVKSWVKVYCWHGHGLLRTLASDPCRNGKVFPSTHPRVRIRRTWKPSLGIWVWMLIMYAENVCCSFITPSPILNVSCQRLFSLTETVPYYDSFGAAIYHKPWCLVYLYVIISYPGSAECNNPEILFNSI